MAQLSMMNDDFMEWTSYDIERDIQEYNVKKHVSGLLDDESTSGVNASGTKVSLDKIIKSITGIFGMPYQFSSIVDPIIYGLDQTEPGESPNDNPPNTQVGRKFGEKIFSVMPILFLTPGEPVFMGDHTKKATAAIANQLAGVLDGNSSDDGGGEFDEGRYYTFNQNFPEYKRYVNVALRALAIYMGIGDISIPVPGKTDTVPLRSIDVEDFMNTEFTKMFGAQCVVPFFLDATTSISESFSNSTQDSMISQTVNGFSQAAREVQFLMGSKDFGGVLKSIGSAVTDVGQNLANAMGDLADVVAGKNMMTRIANELTTIVTGGKIVFPEIWAESDYDRGYDINIKLRSPDPDPVSIFLNIYMPIILLVSMTAPRQIGNSSNSYESPFLVRATYKSIFSCDLGIISSLSITKGGEGNWNVLGQPTTADVSINIKDLYSSMFISKRMGLLANTAQMDYLANMAGLDLNEAEWHRMVALANNIIFNTAGDWTTHIWGNIKSTLNRAAARFIPLFKDTRFIR